MNEFLVKRKKSFSYRLISLFLCITFSTSLIIPPQARAQSFALNLPPPGTMITTSPIFTPPLLRGLKVDPKNPLQFDFIVDSGDSDLRGDSLKGEGMRFIRYFLAALTIPEKELWVNLSPYEKNRIAPQNLSDTDLGRDLLAQDYILKQLTASLIYPENELGKEFWSKVYKKAQDLYGTTEIPVNTFNKVWIIPERASVYEAADGTVFVVDSHLKVMLEEDYLALNKNLNNKDRSTDTIEDTKVKELNRVSSPVVREVILPAIEKEVNEGKNFSQLRQINNAIILATWFKKTLKTSLLGQAYVDKGKILGVDLDDKTAKDQIYEQYLQAFKKGAYNYIKEDVDAFTKQPIPRKYFSGGFEGSGYGEVTKPVEGALDQALQPRALADITLLADRGATQPGAVVALTMVGERPNNVNMASLAKPSTSYSERVRDFRTYLRDPIFAQYETAAKNFTAEDLAAMAPRQFIDPMVLQNLLQEKFRDKMAWATEQGVPIVAGGVMSGLDAAMAAEAGMFALYLSGWQLSEDKGWTDESKYAWDTAPKKLQEIYSYLVHKDMDQNKKFALLIERLDKIFTELFKDVKAQGADLEALKVKFVPKFLEQILKDKDQKILKIFLEKERSVEGFQNLFNKVVEEAFVLRNSEEFKTSNKLGMDKIQLVIDTTIQALELKLTDYLLPTFGDADALHQAQQELAAAMIDSGIAAMHGEDQVHGCKKCGHLGGIVVISPDEQGDQIKDVLGTFARKQSKGSFVARTDTMDARLIKDVRSPYSHYNVTGIIRQDAPDLRDVIKLAVRDNYDFDEPKEVAGIVAALQKHLPGFDEARATRVRQLLTGQAVEDMVDAIETAFPKLATAIRKVWTARGEELEKGKRSLNYGEILKLKETSKSGKAGDIIGTIEEVWDSQRFIELGEHSLTPDTVVIDMQGREMTISYILQHKRVTVEKESTAMQELIQLWDDTFQPKTYKDTVEEKILRELPVGENGRGVVTEKDLEGIVFEEVDSVKKYADPRALFQELVGPEEGKGLIDKNGHVLPKFWRFVMGYEMRLPTLPADPEAKINYQQQIFDRLQASHPIVDQWRKMTDPIPKMIRNQNRTVFHIDTLRELSRQIGFEVPEWDWNKGKTYEDFYQLDIRYGLKLAAIHSIHAARSGARVVWKEAKEPDVIGELVWSKWVSTAVPEVYFAVNNSPSFNAGNPDFWYAFLTNEQIANVKKAIILPGYKRTDPNTWGEYKADVEAMKQAAVNFSFYLAKRAKIAFHFVTIASKHSSALANWRMFKAMGKEGYGGFVKVVQDYEYDEGAPFLGHQNYANLTWQAAMRVLSNRGKAATAADSHGLTEDVPGTVRAAATISPDVMGETAQLITRVQRILMQTKIDVETLTEMVVELHIMLNSVRTRIQAAYNRREASKSIAAKLGEVERDLKTLKTQAVSVEELLGQAIDRAMPLEGSDRVLITLEDIDLEHMDFRFSNPLKAYSDPVKGLKRDVLFVLPAGLRQVQKAIEDTASTAEKSNLQKKQERIKVLISKGNQLLAEAPGRGPNAASLALTPLQQAQLRTTALRMVPPTGGILAADESVGSAKNRLDMVGLENTPENRQWMRQLMLTAPGLAESGIAAVILDQDTYPNTTPDGQQLLVKYLLANGILPGIKTDKGLDKDPESAGENIPKSAGLEALPEMLAKFKALGAVFTKWRTTQTIDPATGLPTDANIEKNAEVQAKQARLTQEAGLVPIVEPEVLLDGAHDIAASYSATTRTLEALFKALVKEGAWLGGLVLKTSMILSGNKAENRADSDTVGFQTLKALLKTVPSEVPAIVFLSGGQGDEEVVQNLDGVIRASQKRFIEARDAAVAELRKENKNKRADEVASLTKAPWEISYSFGRGLQRPALMAWQGKPEKFNPAQSVMVQTAKATQSARLGELRKTPQAGPSSATLATVEPKLSKDFPSLFSEKEINGRRLEPLKVIAALTEVTGSDIPRALNARRELLESKAPAREKYAFPKLNDSFADGQGNTRTFGEIVQGMIDNFLGIESKLSWRMNDEVAIPEDINPLARPGLQVTGPSNPLNMAINQLNALLSVRMPDLEDAAAAWFIPAGAPQEQTVGAFQGIKNEVGLLSGQWEAGRAFENKGKSYKLTQDKDKRPTTIQRVPSIHLLDKHIMINGKPVPAIDVAYALHALNTYGALKQNGSGNYYYQPKIQTPEEALIVEKKISKLEELMGLPLGTIKIEALYEEGNAGRWLPVIMWVWRHRLIGTNVGRWDYIGSLIEMWKDEAVFPDPQGINMNSPNLIAYQRYNALLNLMAGMKNGEQTNGAPIGGMAAVMLYPQSDPYGRSKNNPKALRAMKIDKLRERLIGLIFVPENPLAESEQPTLENILSGKVKGRLYDTYRQSWVATTDLDYVAAGNGPLRADIKELQALLDAPEAWETLDGKNVAPKVSSGLIKTERDLFTTLKLLNTDGKIAPWIISKDKFNKPEDLFNDQLWNDLYTIPKGEITIEHIQHAFYMEAQYGFQILNGNYAAAIDDYELGLRFMNDLATYRIFNGWTWTAFHHQAAVTKDGWIKGPELVADKGVIPNQNAIEIKAGTQLTPEIFNQIWNAHGNWTKAFFDEQDRKGAVSAFDRKWADVIMDVLKRQHLSNRYLQHSPRVLFVIAEATPELRKQILDAIFDLSREEVVAKVKDGTLNKEALSARDYVFDYYEPAALEEQNDMARSQTPNAASLALTPLQQAQLRTTALRMVPPTGGILAADESVGSAKNRLDMVGLENTPENRQWMRQLMLTAPGLAESGIAAVILDQDTYPNTTPDGQQLLVKYLLANGILPGIKTDKGLDKDPESAGENIPKSAGLEALPEMLAKFKALGAVFTKWRTTQTIDPATGLPTDANIEKNAEVQAKQARLTQEAGLVPIVEPEVLLDGAHDIAASYSATTRTLEALFKALVKEGAWLGGLVLKTSMILSGNKAENRADSDTVGFQTLKALLKTVPSEVPAIVFLSGGQGDEEVVQNLDGVIRASQKRFIEARDAAVAELRKENKNKRADEVASLTKAPWEISYSFGRGLQRPALMAWQGKPEKFNPAQSVMVQTAKATQSARLGELRKTPQAGPNAASLANWRSVYKIPPTFSSVMQPYGLTVKGVQAIRLFGERSVEDALNDVHTQFVASTSINQALGSIHFAGQGKDAKVTADANAVFFSAADIEALTKAHTNQAIVILANEGERDGSVALPRGRIYWSGYQGGHKDYTDLATYNRDLDDLRGKNVDINYFAGDALENTNGLAVEGAQTQATDSWSLAALKDDMNKRGSRLLVDDNMRKAGVSYNEKTDAGIEPLDLPSVVIGKLARARGIKEGSEQFNVWVNTINIVTLGPRSATLQKDSGDHRHKAIIDDARALQEKYPGLKIITPGDGDFAARAISSMGLKLDGREYLTFGRSGSAEATIAELVAAIVPHGQFTHRFVSEKATAKNVSPERADGYTAEEMDVFENLGYPDGAPFGTRHTADFEGVGAFAMTSVTGASQEQFGNEFSNAMKRVNFEKSESSPEGTVTVNTLVVTADGSAFLVRTQFASSDIEQAKAAIKTASPEAKAFVEQQPKSLGAARPSSTDEARPNKSLGAAAASELPPLKDEYTGVTGSNTANPGGIDLNSNLMRLEIKRDGNGVPLPINMQPIMNIEGLVPVIINIRPVSNLPMLLGLKEKDPYLKDGQEAAFASVVK